MRLSRYIVLLLVAVLALATAAQETSVGYIYIETDLPQAEVIIDSDTIAIAETPALCTLTVGQHTLTVRKEYYAPKSTTLEIKAGQVLRRRINFVEPDRPGFERAQSMAVYRRTGHLTILTDFGSAAVFVDSVRMAEPAPVTLTDLAAGPHRIRLEHEGLLLDTIVQIEPESTVVMQASLAAFWPGEAEEGTAGLAPVSLMIELPPCVYRRDTVAEARYEVEIRGVDPRITANVGDSSFVLTHHELAVEDVLWSYKGEKIEKRILDTTLVYRLLVPTDTALRLDLSMLVNDGRRFKDRRDIAPVTKSFRVAGDLNGGREIQVRLRIEPSGEVIFRYW